MADEKKDVCRYCRSSIDLWPNCHREKDGRYIDAFICQECIDKIFPKNDKLINGR